MTHKALIRQLQISCLGLDAVDPLRLLVDDVIAALAQTERTWVGLTDEEIANIGFESADRESAVIQTIDKLKEKNNG
jgi:hypothetical protein